MDNEEDFEDEVQASNNANWPFTVMICVVAICTTICCLGSFYIVATH